MKNIEKRLERIACMIADGDGSVCRAFSDGYEDGANICENCPLHRICNDKDKLVQWLKSNVVQNDEKEMMVSMVIDPKCSECTFCVYVPKSNRYYCSNPAAMAGIGSRVVCRCKRHTKDNIKTSHKWCPFREENRK